MIVCTADNPYQTSQDGSRESWRYDHNRLYHPDHDHRWPETGTDRRPACTVDGCGVRKPPGYDPERECEPIETAEWCVNRNAYADENVCGPDADHVHYEVQYGGRTGKVFTSAEEQQRRRIAVTPTCCLFEEVAASLLHVHGDDSPVQADGAYMAEHPAMVEILRRQRTITLA